VRCSRISVLMKSRNSLVASFEEMFKAVSYVIVTVIVLATLNSR